MSLMWGNSPVAGEDNAISCGYCGFIVRKAELVTNERDLGDGEVMGRGALRGRVKKTKMTAEVLLRELGEGTPGKKKLALVNQERRSMRPRAGSSEPPLLGPKEIVVIDGQVSKFLIKDAEVDVQDTNFHGNCPFLEDPPRNKVINVMDPKSRQKEQQVGDEVFLDALRSYLNKVLDTLKKLGFVHQEGMFKAKHLWGVYSAKVSQDIVVESAFRNAFTKSGGGVKFRKPSKKDRIPIPRLDTVITCVYVACSLTTHNWISVSEFMCLLTTGKVPYLQGADHLFGESVTKRIPLSRLRHLLEKNTKRPKVFLKHAKRFISYVNVAFNDLADPCILYRAVSRINLVENKRLWPFVVATFIYFSFHEKGFVDDVSQHAAILCYAASLLGDSEGSTDGYCMFWGKQRDFWQGPNDLFGTPVMTMESLLRPDNKSQLSQHLSRMSKSIVCGEGYTIPVLFRKEAKFVSIVEEQDSEPSQLNSDVESLPVYDYGEAFSQFNERRTTVEKVYTLLLTQQIELSRKTTQEMSMVSSSVDVLELQYKPYMQLFYDIANAFGLDSTAEMCKYLRNMVTANPPEGQDDLLDHTLQKNEHRERRQNKKLIQTIDLGSRDADQSILHINYMCRKAVF
eukprot:CAMPEP_0203757202 /NCGR_PEP_ID=MMETSP0098-20131031/10334_1 /ASSEMBLY_ACC=CAM_ASM_000208 /TAXON_ID=96639 /ORGANISM=" , Strain NY0313808BC1" /LENGTH=624 /DNA_ID=CAMNT_0050649355 /DNA_START=159 /DNA_END=2034 /DNA_ORIENTATION=+